MQAAPAAAAAVAGVLAAITVAVFIYNNTPEVAADEVDLTPRGYKLSELRLQLKAAVLAAGFKETDIPHGKVYVVDYSPVSGEYPARPGPPLVPVMPGGGPATIAAGKAILVDLGDRLPAAGAAAAAGDIISAVAAAAASAATAAVKEAFKEHETDASTVLSPTGQQYERLAEDQVDGWLLTFCGLRIVPSSKRRLADSDSAAGGRQWDARFLTSVVPGWAPPVKDSFKFIVYGGSDYHPPAVIKERKLSPTKGVPKAQYFAVLEYTAYDQWFDTWTSATGKQRKSLLPRLEQRLEIVAQRVGAAGSWVANICNVVAVVGVAGNFSCSESVERILSAPSAATTFPLLTAMFNAHRFVFFQFSAVASPPKVVTSPAATSPSAAGGGGGAAAAAAGK